MRSCHHLVVTIKWCWVYMTRSMMLTVSRVVFLGLAYTGGLASNGNGFGCRLEWDLTWGWFYWQLRVSDTGYGWALSLLSLLELTWTLFVVYSASCGFETLRFIVWSFKVMLLGLETCWWELSSCLSYWLMIKTHLFILCSLALSFYSWYDCVYWKPFCGM